MKLRWSMLSPEKFWKRAEPLNSLEQYLVLVSCFLFPANMPPELYGGSVSTTSMLASGMLASCSKQSPLNIWYMFLVSLS